MDLTLGPEQEAVRDAIRGVLADRQSPARVRQVMVAEPPVDEVLWHEAAALGWFGLSLSEAAGGAGYGLAETMLLFQEIGRGVVPIGGMKGLSRTFTEPVAVYGRRASARASVASHRSEPACT